MQLKCLAIGCTLLLECNVPLTAEEREIQPAKPAVLLRIEGKLKVALKNACPEATFTWKGTALTVEHKTQQFMVHNIDKDGRIAKDALQESGPSHAGFQLTLFVDRGARQAAVPQDVREAYWNSHMNKHYFDEKKEGYVWVVLLYGVKTDRQLLEQIKNTIKTTAEAKE